MVKTEKTLRIPINGIHLEGELFLPKKSQGIVLFAHGSGSSRHSPRNQFVAKRLFEAEIGSLLFDLLTSPEDELEQSRFDIDLLTLRLVRATEWLFKEEANGQPLGYFGASTGAAAALKGAAQMGDRIGAVVSRGGRADLANEALGKVVSPTLLLVGEYDDFVIELNRQALSRLTCKKEMKIIPGATHLFEEPGTLEEVSLQAIDWFKKYLKIK